MIPDPGSVRAYGHDRGRERPLRTELGKKGSIRCVARKEQALAFAPEDVAVVTSVELAGPSPPPMLDLDCFDREFSLPVAMGHGLVPAQLGQAPQPGF